MESSGRGHGRSSCRWEVLLWRERNDDDDMALFKMIDECVKVGDVEAAASVVATLQAEVS